MPGPPPNPSARRRNAAGAFTTLPAAGRSAPAPPWPLPPLDDGHQARRAQLWAALWATPQAELWSRHLWPYPVARYAEMLVAWEAAPAGTSGAMVGEIRAMETALALSPAGLLRVRAVIGEAGAVGTVRHLAVVDLTGHGAAAVDLAPGVDLDAPGPPGPAC